MAVNLSLLDQTIEELEELKGFEPLPAGTHRLIIGWRVPEDGINDVPTVFLKMKVVETIEMASSQEEAPNPGDEADLMFMLYKKDGTANNISQGQLREILETLAPKVGGVSSKEVMENSEGAEVVMTISVSENKENGRKSNRYVAMIVE